MNALLIHANNTSLLNVFSSHSTAYLTFNNNEEIDVQLTEFIKSRLATELYCGIFIKAYLSSNYMEFIGLRLALHIRLTAEFPNLQRLPIIIITEESFEELARLYPYPGFLFTNGVYIANEDPAKINQFLFKLKNNHLAGCLHLNEFINSINVDPPANYLSHHSITNEWSILRWSKVLALPLGDSLLREIKKNTECLLYYKFLQSKFPIDNDADQQIYKINGKSKILYIDDEWNKGWNLVLGKFFSASPDIEFITFEGDFRDKPRDIIIQECLDGLIDIDPDIVLLDLRLCKTDFGINNTKELTGLKLLELIKQHNKGIQVIIITASNKVWNLLELQKSGSNGFILKEGPEQSFNKKFSSESLKSLMDQCQSCLRNVFLKELWLLHLSIKGALSKNPLDKFFNKSLPDQIRALKYQNLILSEVDASFGILNTDNENRFNHSMMMLHKVVEYINEIFFLVPKNAIPEFYDGTKVDFYDKNTKSWKKNSHKIYNKKHKKCEPIKLEYLRSTTNKTMNLLVKKLKVTDISLQQSMISLSECRNDFIHPGSAKNKNLNKLSSIDIIEWTRSISSLIKYF